MLKEVVETFNIGASYIIGSYILPGEPGLKNYRKILNRTSINIEYPPAVCINNCSWAVEQGQQFSISGIQ